MTSCSQSLQTWALCCCCLLVAVLPVSTAAQPSSLPPPHALSHRPLAEALLTFQHSTGIDLSFDPEVVSRKWTPSTLPEEASPEALLRAMLEGTDLFFYRLSSGTYAIETAAVAAWQRGSLAGYVLDQDTGRPLSRANVLLANASPRGTATTASGSFTFSTLVPGRYVLRVSHVGYETQIDTVQVLPDVRMELRVGLQARPLPLTITPIIVEDYLERTDLRLLGATASHEDLRQVGILGTADAVRSINNLPGVRVGDALADVHIQGGEAGEHQFRLDGVPVFEPVHLRGLLGAFNPFALDRIKVHKAGFSVAEGSNLAGVIDAEHALAGPGSHPLDVQADPLSVNARLNLHAGSPDGIKGQLMAAYRTSVWDVYSPAHLDTLLLQWNTPDPFLLRASLLPIRATSVALFNQLVQGLDSLPVPLVPELGFHDVHAAGRLRHPSGHTLDASYYRGSNRLDSRRLAIAFDAESQEQPNPDRYAWVNETAQARWTALLTSDALLATRLRSSLYHLQHEYNALDNQNARRYPFGDGRYFVVDLTPADDGNRLRETALESTLDFSHGAGDATAGVEVAHTVYRFSIDDVFTRSIIHRGDAWQASAFAEERLALGPRLTLTSGLRLTYLDRHTTVYAEPRLDIRYTLPKTPLGALTIRGATGLYRQYLNQFDISSISPSALFPAVRFWMPLDSTIVPPKAYHLAADVVLQPSDAWRFRIESYYKDQEVLLRIDYPALWRRNVAEEPDGGPVPITHQHDFLQYSSGYAYGTALILEHATEKTRSSIRYEHNIARRRYPFQDAVRMEPVPWSEPHRLDLAFDWKPTARFITTARWRGTWGRTWAFRRAYYDFLGTDPTQVPLYGDFDFRRPADHTLPPFRQLDLGLAYSQPLGPADLQFRLDLLNATNRNNVADRSLLEVVEDRDVSFVPQDRYLLTRTLSMAVRLQW